ncbi:MAG: 16S rRNA (adenine(1518)-N(6)/adenine(1519)-N(6))-dimethyltransferase RsmA [Eubacteriales bacterium]|jgi:16S rRNA (adenine1518-N6/adenine1519-N6)-dimethyltransferase
MNLCSSKEIKELMQTFGIRPSRALGQNFLIDSSVVERTAGLCCEGRSASILEIGPGVGCLTERLAERYEKVVAIEIDSRLIPVLKFMLGNRSNIKIINADVLKCNLREITAPYLDGGLSVCANLPYYITTPILMLLLESGIPFDYITVMVQAEVAARLCASPGSQEYGAITASLAYFGKAERLFFVPARAFWPAPKVDSSVVRIRLYKEKPILALDEKILSRVIKSAFGQRRKTLVNALSAGFSELPKSALAEIVEKCGHPADIRGERLGIAEFVAIANEISRQRDLK